MSLPFAHGSLAALVLFSLACSPARRDDDDTCARPCGTACCAAGETCHPDKLVCETCTTTTTCAASGAVCGSVPDGCGGTLACGSCSAPLTCGGGGVANQCGSGVCVKATCASLGAQCGRAGDGCGGSLECGTCGGVLTCGVPSANKCGSGTCVPENDLSMCQRFGHNCAGLVDFDNCGNSRVIASCGGCSAPLACDDGVCRCEAESEAELCEAGNLCGTRSLRDRCGATRAVTCDACAAYSAECSNDWDCTGDAVCFSLDDSDRAVCSRYCSEFQPCQPGGVCLSAAGDQLCAKACTSAAQCESGQSCVNTGNGGGCVPSDLVQP